MSAFLWPHEVTPQPRELMAGDEIAVWSMGEAWFPCRFSHFDQLGNLQTSNIMRFQPPSTIWKPFHGFGPGGWLFADEPAVKFLQPCPACSVRITNAAKGAAILHDDYSWVRGPKQSKDCQVCRATQHVLWQPFAQQPIATQLQEITGL
jgi:hypothetical protein